MTMPRQPIYHYEHIELPLTRGYSAIVDLDCPNMILECAWRPTFSRRRCYAVTSLKAKPARTVTLHRYLMPTAIADIDHIDGDGLNNRMNNLRACTRTQNMANMGANAGGTSAFRGVCWNKQRGKWQAQLGAAGSCGKRVIHLGRFDNEEEAARAWDEAALEHYDPAFLRLNFPLPT
jgi:hypothetical protein